MRLVCGRCPDCRAACGAVADSLACCLVRLKVYAACPSFRIRVAYLHLAAAFRNWWRACGPESRSAARAHSRPAAARPSFDQRWAGLQQGHGPSLQRRRCPPAGSRCAALVDSELGSLRYVAAARNARIDDGQCGNTDLAKRRARYHRIQIGQRRRRRVGYPPPARSGRAHRQDLDGSQGAQRLEPGLTLPARHLV